MEESREHGEEVLLHSYTKERFLTSFEMTNAFWWAEIYRKMARGRHKGEKYIHYGLEKISSYLICESVATM